MHFPGDWRHQVSSCVRGASVFLGEMPARAFGQFLIRLLELRFFIHSRLNPTASPVSRGSWFRAAAAERRSQGSGWPVELCFHLASWKLWAHLALNLQAILGWAWSRTLRDKTMKGQATTLPYQLWVILPNSAGGSKQSPMSSTQFLLVTVTPGSPYHNSWGGPACQMGLKPAGKEVGLGTTKTPALALTPSPPLREWRSGGAQLPPRKVGQVPQRIRRTMNQSQLLSCKRTGDLPAPGAQAPVSC